MQEDSDDSVNIIALNQRCPSQLLMLKTQEIISRLPQCLQSHFVPAKSMIETSIGNVGMVLHCAPLLLNTGWTEENSTYKYYYDGITLRLEN